MKSAGNATAPTTSSQAISQSEETTLTSTTSTFQGVVYSTSTVNFTGIANMDNASLELYYLNGKTGPVPDGSFFSISVFSAKNYTLGIRSATIFQLNETSGESVAIAEPILFSGPFLASASPHSWTRISSKSPGNIARDWNFSVSYNHASQNYMVQILFDIGVKEFSQGQPYYFDYGSFFISEALNASDVIL